MRHADGQAVSMTHTVLDALRNDINNCVYKDGQFITEAEISQKFNVSKTPAREALNYLCQEGLLDKIPRKGYMVKQLSMTELQHLLEFRNILERASVEWVIRYASDSEIQSLDALAHSRLDPTAADLPNRYNALNVQFHLSVAQLSRNTYLIDALQNVLNLLRRDLIMDMRQTSLEQALCAHSMIVDAMKARDLDKALRITSDQIEVVERRLYLR